ncbi:sigma-54-dependent transcriptional regulator [Anaerobacillus isosaccharinicus]|uniref:Response regulator n=1 Tax=Anaerobacillus isosaccharinicus TaxID=1532552 RepID=A0A1S2L592_9BACI|nr:sigma-54 dependent transcriptional regulator [Anaerobacillus isosaccharinicus]MBA5584981.1 sigma-54-dependent Fis family transcriptional regulator [Anaerobacillus isosaccharinicus]QOY36665.1 sigma-54-dependent Fis family transcriptional regulator [Anaerobacillus isosaccharinicus]
MANLLIVDDEREVGNFLAHLLGGRGYHVTVVYSGKDFFAELEKKQYQLAMIDVRLPDTNGLEILKRLKKIQPACKSIIMTGFSMVQTAIEAIKLGANDYIEKPFDDIDQLEHSIEEMLKNDLTHGQNEINEIASKLDFVVGESEQMRHLLTMAFKIAKKNINVLLEGETGTGKEVFARFIHEASVRQEQPFIGVNCGALSETLLESELFGHEKGSFTGAIQMRKGLFEIASQGTLFLDEVAEASPQIQVKLLRILETREFMRVGSERPLRTNARIIAASHVNLEQAVRAKSFREDLLYRLNVVKLQIPPLRSRKEDIVHLINFLLAKQPDRQIKFTDEAITLLMNYDWPGNIRELANVVTRATTLSEGETDLVTPQYLPQHLQEQKEKKKVFTLQLEHPSRKNHRMLKPSKNSEFEQYVNGWVYDLLKFWQSDEIEFEVVSQHIKQFEATVGQSFMRKALRETLGNRKEAAAVLKISERKLRYLLNEKGG